MCEIHGTDSVFGDCGWAADFCFCCEMGTSDLEELEAALDAALDAELDAPPVVTSDAPSPAQSPPAVTSNAPSPAQSPPPVVTRRTPPPPPNKGVALNIHHSCAACSKYRPSLILTGLKSTRHLNFEDKANRIHGFKYSYEKVVYKCMFSPVTITCAIHGDFDMTPEAHLSRLSHGCAECKNLELAVVCSTKRNKVGD